jgi:hypothetical protein
MFGIHCLLFSASYSVFDTVSPTCILVTTAVKSVLPTANNMPVLINSP